MTVELNLQLKGEGERPAGSQRLVSVLLPCSGQLEYTRLCVARLLRQARPPVELLALDVASLDGTAEFLLGVQTAVPWRVEIVRAETDREIPAAVREALGRARGDYLVLLNHDVLVTDGWLQQLTALAELDPTIGLVGPMSNGAALPQRVDEVPFRLRRRAGGGVPGELDLAPLEAFARQYREQHRGRWLETDHLGGCCLLKRALLDRLGPLEGQAGLQVFDTDALCQQARAAGSLLAVCADLYVHQLGR